MTDKVDDKVGDKVGGPRRRSGDGLADQGVSICTSALVFERLVCLTPHPGLLPVEGEKEKRAAHPFLTPSRQKERYLHILRIASEREAGLVSFEMRLGILIVALAMVAAACSRTRVGTNSGSFQQGTVVRTNLPIVRPSALAPGRIDSVNLKARYVVISFPIGTVPPLDTHLNAYRNGLKVGELKVTPPQQNNFTAADIINGECQLGDEVRY